MAENIFNKPGLAVNQLPPVSAEDDGKVLMVVDGEWAVAELPVDNTPDSEEES